MHRSHIHHRHGIQKHLPVPSNSPTIKLDYDTNMGQHVKGIALCALLAMPPVYALSRYFGASNRTAIVISLASPGWARLIERYFAGDLTNHLMGCSDSFIIPLDFSRRSGIYQFAMGVPLVAIVGTLSIWARMRSLLSFMGLHSTWLVLGEILGCYFRKQIPLFPPSTSKKQPKKVQKSGPLPKPSPKQIFFLS